MFYFLHSALNYFIFLSHKTSQTTTAYLDLSHPSRTLVLAAQINPTCNLRLQSARTPMNIQDEKKYMQYNNFFLFLAAVCQAPYGPPDRYLVGFGPSSIATGDFNNDAKLDLVVANAYDNSVSVLLGNENGTFQDQTTYGTEADSYSILSADLNDDGKLDLAVTNGFDNTLSVLLGNGDATFQNQMLYAVGVSPVSIIAGTFRDDAKLDLAMVNAGDNSVTIFLNSCS